MTTEVLRDEDAREKRTLAGVLIATVAVTLATGIAAPTLALASALVLVGVLVLWRLGWTTLTWWMVWLTPLQAAFVIDVGITLRLAFLAGLAAIAMAAATRRLVWIRWHRGARWLAAFLTIVSLASVVMTPFAPVHSLVAQSGWRGLPVMRPLIQCLQLLAMVGILLVVAYQAREVSRAYALFRAAWLSGIVVSAYGAYMFIAPLVGIPAIDINNAMNTNFTRGAVEHGMSLGGSTLPRVRSTFVEPLNFANYLLLVLGGLWVGMRLSAHPRRYRLLMAGVLALFLIGVNSRGAMLGAGVGLFALIVFAKAPGQVIRSVVKAVALAAVFGVVVSLLLPFLIPGSSGAVLIEFFTGRLGSALNSNGRVWSDIRDISPVVAAHPLFGVGFGNLPFYLAGSVEGAASGVVDAGSVYTRLLAETGLVGLACYLGFVGSLISGLRRVGRDVTRSAAARTMAQALFFVIIADAVQRIAHVGIATDVHLWVVFGLAVGVVYRPAPPTPTPERQT